MNRITFLLSACAISLVVLSGCSGKASSPAPSSEPVTSVEDDKLPMSVDLTQDISKLDYGQLRLLRSYVYACHGQWFMEQDLNSYFGSRTKWYWDLCYNKWAYWDFPDTVSAQQKAIAMGYNEMLESDYPKTYDMIELSAEEKEFVSRIDARMKEMKNNKYFFNDQGERLWNADQVVNYDAFYNTPSSFREMLRKYNLAFEPTKYEQLFNVYEDNEYHQLSHFVTTDVFMQAFHMLFSYEMKVLENGRMSKLLQTFLTEMVRDCQEKLAVCPEMRNAADETSLAYFDVALRLLTGDSIHQAMNVDDSFGEPHKRIVEAELQLIAAAEDAPSPLFRTETNFCYSLFKPRGHYTRNERAGRYFRTMMWLQKGCFYREDDMQLEQAMYIANMLNQNSQAADVLRCIDRMLRYMMGEPDNMSVLNIADYMRDNQITLNVVFTEQQKEQVGNWLKEQFQSRNKIKSFTPDADVMQDEINLLPQRYTIDGELLSRLYDPTPNAEKAFPNGVEVMDSLKAMESGYRSYNRDLYTDWLFLLRLIQRSDQSIPPAKGAQPWQTTQAWQKKSLNSALASWALLKHDAVLYAEQPICAECGGGDALPDPHRNNYVEPNCTFWNKLLSVISTNEIWIGHNTQGADNKRLLQRIRNLKGLIEKCREAAELERTGSLSPRVSASLNNIGSELEYFTLSVLDPDFEYMEWDKVSGPDRNVAQVADVFTRNVTGCEKSGILYEATGAPNIIYVVVEVDGEYYVTRGASYSYYEFVRPLGDRLTDEQWQEMLRQGQAPAVPEWFAPLLIGEPVEVDERYIYSTGC